MTKENFIKAKDLISEIENIEEINLPENISDINLVRDDGVINKWDGSLNVGKKFNFKITGKNDDYNRYFISIGDLYLTSEESNKLIDTISLILSDRKKKLDAELDQL